MVVVVFFQAKRGVDAGDIGGTYLLACRCWWFPWELEGGTGVGWCCLFLSCPRGVRRVMFLEGT